MHNKISQCIDINSPYCPCILAETNSCVFCSHLRGKNTCDCNWGGVCILYEKFWQSNNNRKNISQTRSEFETDYVLLDQMNENVYIISFDVPSELAVQLSKPGTFVFLRRPDDQQFCHFPVGVMNVDNNTVKLVIETVGPKSKRIFGDNRRILVRGPYYNGILGQPWIDSLSGGRVLLVAGGIGQAPALPIVKKLISNGNDVFAILAPGKVGKVFIDHTLTSMGVRTQVVSSLRRTGIEIASTLFEESDLVVSAGPDEQHYGIIDAMAASGINIPMAATNNATMCCGEGICGSCQKQTRNHGVVRTCKVQTDFIELVRD